MLCVDRGRAAGIGIRYRDSPPRQESTSSPQTRRRPPFAPSPELDTVSANPDSHDAARIDQERRQPPDVDHRRSAPLEIP